MRRYLLACLVIPALAAAQDPHAAHQQASPSPLSKDEVVTYVKADLAISAARDSMQAQYAMVRNKKVEVLNSLREKLRLQIDSILKKAGMTQADYDHKTFLVSTDNGARHLFDSVVVALTGAPLNEVEEELTRLMVQYDGDVEVADDGTLLYRFDALQKRTATPAPR